LGVVSKSYMLRTLCSNIKLQHNVTCREFFNIRADATENTTGPQTRRCASSDNINVLRTLDSYSNEGLLFLLNVHINSLLIH
jgi:hypothetical protein